MQLAPQSDNLRLIAGAALAKAGRLDEAGTILRSGAFAPHGGGTADKAAALLRLVETAEAGAGAGALPALLAGAERVLAETLDPA